MLITRSTQATPSFVGPKRSFLTFHFLLIILDDYIISLFVCKLEFGKVYVWILPRAFFPLLFHPWFKSLFSPYCFTPDSRLYFPRIVLPLIQSFIFPVLFHPWFKALFSLYCFTPDSKLYFPCIVSPLIQCFIFHVLFHPWFNALFSLYCFTPDSRLKLIFPWKFWRNVFSVLHDSFSLFRYSTTQQYANCCNMVN